MDCYFASRTEERRSPGPGRRLIVGACVVAGVILFMALTHLLVQTRRRTWCSGSPSWPGRDGSRA